VGVSAATHDLSLAGDLSDQSAASVPSNVGAPASFIQGAAAPAVATVDALFTDALQGSL
jgi:hypothetical protein